MAYASNDLHRVKSSTESVVDTVADRASDLAEKAGDQIGRVVGTAEQTVKKLGEQSSEASRNVQHVADNMKSAIDKSIKDQPMTTLAVAAAIGFTLGALWKS